MKNLIAKTVLICFVLFLCSCGDSDGSPKISSSENEYPGTFVVDGPEETLDDFNYTYISGNLEITGTSLQHLNQLLILKGVEGDIIVEDNHTLNNLNGFDGFEYVGGDIRFTNNPQLRPVNLRNACQRLIDDGGSIEGKIYFDGVEIVL